MRAWPIISARTRRPNLHACVLFRVAKVSDPLRSLMKKKGQQEYDFLKEMNKETLSQLGITHYPAM